MMDVRNPVIFRQFGQIIFQRNKLPMLVTLYSLTYNLYQSFHVDVYKKNQLWETIIFTNYEIIYDSLWFKVGFVWLDLCVARTLCGSIFSFLCFVSHCLSFCLFLMAIVVTTLRLTNSDYIFGNYLFSTCEDFTMSEWNLWKYLTYLK